MITQAYEKNPEGAGFAWREKAPNGEEIVHWVKGLDLPESIKLFKKLPLPYIAHFRIASSGFAKSAALCHPFPIQKDVSLATEGKTKGFVMFHNGYWNNWKTGVMDGLKGTTYKIPPGRWSDTRAMAWMAAHYGVAILNFIDEKAVAFSPKNIDVFGVGWSKIGEVWASNRFFDQGGTKMYPHNQGKGSLYTTPPASMTHSTSSNSGKVISSESAREATVLSNDAEPRGALTVVPFDRAVLLNKIGQLSKNQLKHARKATEKNRPFALQRDEKGALKVLVL